MASIWSVREKSLIWLNNDLQQEARVIQEGFDYIDKIVDILQNISIQERDSQKGVFCRICMLTLSKFNRLLLGSYSLMLDAIAQEAGALLRPIIETYELLVYFRQDISRIDEVLNDKLPSAGIIGERISGDFKKLRGYLNDNASHFSFKPESLRHLFDHKAQVQPSPSHSLSVFLKNITIINAFQIFMLVEAINCLYTIDYDVTLLDNEISKWRIKSINIFSTNNI